MWCCNVAKSISSNFFEVENATSGSGTTKTAVETYSNNKMKIPHFSVRAIPFAIFAFVG
jgi:hypothetical protein